MKRLLLLTTIGVSAALAGEWVVPMNIKGRPSNHPTKYPMVKASPQLDFIGFRINLGDEAQAGVRVRNAKHKRGEASIRIRLENADLVVQRVDLLKPISKIEAQGDGEHLIETFLHKGTPYEILGKVTKGKLENALIVRTKK